MLYVQLDGQMCANQALCMETVAVVYNLQEALLLKSYLDGHGITAVIPDEYTAQVNWLYITAIGGIRLEVPKAFAEQARQLLADKDPD